MSASLVGSEMCIRDSCTHWMRDVCAGTLVQRGPCGGGVLKVPESHRWPVSYTHLTLPTICSV
eukprot:6444157-Alexandrium_andersonii.AAC.1